MTNAYECTPQPQRSQAADPLRTRDFRLLVAGLGISLFASLQGRSRTIRSSSPPDSPHLSSFFSPLDSLLPSLSPRLLFAQPTTKIQIQQINNQSTDRQTNKHKNKDNNKSTITNTKAISKRAATP
ncbi:hypothetical protein [Bifidobacterium sp.]|uniref:hypothetical protein n=1 Tax=Bifidobacterium sp. TaxID=41200 RepID=UPI00257FC341|nr:hypothetical protein [Bifidobacterium sp.]MBS5400383.1 hypothetical protein [Bifidobacterium sp.]